MTVIGVKNVHARTGEASGTSGASPNNTPLVWRGGVEHLQVRGGF